MSNLDVCKILANVLCPFVKLDGKNDGDIAEPIQPTVLEWCTDFLQKLDPGPPKMVLLQF